MRVYGGGGRTGRRRFEGAKQIVSDVSGQAASTAARLGLSAGNNVGEIGYDDDVDHDLRDVVEAITTTELLDEDADDVLDAVLLWWREDDGDLTDALVDANTLLADDGVIWLLTPKTGRDGYVEPSEIAEATQTAGLPRPPAFRVGTSWTIARLAPSEVRTATPMTGWRDGCRGRCTRHRTSPCATPTASR